MELWKDSPDNAIFVELIYKLLKLQNFAHNNSNLSLSINFKFYYIFKHYIRIFSYFIFFKWYKYSFIDKHKYDKYLFIIYIYTIKPNF